MASLREWIGATLGFLPARRVREIEVVADATQRDAAELAERMERLADADEPLRKLVHSMKRSAFRRQIREGRAD